MSHINVVINGQQYRMACETGQEQRLLRLAHGVEARVEKLKGRFGEVGDIRLVVMAAMIAQDELADAEARIRALEDEAAGLREAKTAAAERARTTQVAVTAAFNSASQRLEAAAQALDRPAATGIAVG